MSVREQLGISKTERSFGFAIALIVAAGSALSITSPGQPAAKPKPPERIRQLDLTALSQTLGETALHFSRHTDQIMADAARTVDVRALSETPQVVSEKPQY